MKLKAGERIEIGQVVYLDGDLVFLCDAERHPWGWAIRDIEKDEEFFVKWSPMRGFTDGPLSSQEPI